LETVQESFKILIGVIMKPVSILIDSNIIRAGVQLEPEDGSWEEFPRKIPKLKRKEFTHLPEWLQIEITHLPEIVECIENGNILVYLSSELQFQINSQFRECFPERAVFNQFARIQYQETPELVIDYERTVVGGSPEQISQQKQSVIERIQDPLYERIKSNLPDSQWEDALHIYTAEKNGLEYFLTVDRKLVRTIHSRKLNLHVQVVLPSQLLYQLKLQPLLQELQLVLSSIYGPRLSRVILYGSQARGDAEDGSDIDIMVVLNGKVDEMREIGLNSQMLSSLSLKYDATISCLYMNREKYHSGEGPLLRNIRKEGKTLSSQPSGG